MHSVIWSKQSLNKAQEIVEYLRTKWTEKEVQRFLTSLKQFEKNIALFPNIYPKSETKKGLRKAVISKQNSILYKVGVQKREVLIYTILNNKLETNK